MCNVTQWFRYPILWVGRTSNRGEPRVIPPTNKVIVYEPMELPLRKQGIDEVETTTSGCISTGVEEGGRKST